MPNGNIKTATTTVCITGKGTFSHLTVNGGTMGSITIYDNSAGSGTEIAIIASPLAGMLLIYDYEFDTGLTIVTAAATNITWKSYHRV